MSLRLAYTVLSPFYDWFVGPVFRAARHRSIATLPLSGERVLLNGVGTGLDLPLLPAGRRYVGLDLTRAMLARSRARAGGIVYSSVQGDSLTLPFCDASFDHALLHLILAVVPEPALALAETARVVRQGGCILIFDKFLARGRRAPLRRLFSPLAARVATRLDVVFDDLLERVPGVALVYDQPSLAGGWFRLIQLKRL
jgi:phosphatidylethanolamine/phosphatidyl-N-methylethanolamine N-methyltransferase